jgi:ABC-type polysaccharide/polyol phosphate transport system, ATPase component
MDNGAESMAVIAENVHKTYRLGQYTGLRAAVQRHSGAVAQSAQSIDALAGVSFSIRRGECFGIVGGNGSGKSTLLQILAQITLPTRGGMTVRGRVLPLLAVGSGFHPELTGRENAVLFGTILGVPGDVIKERLPEVVKFADLERHIDTPNKRYSDGMQARLSFALAVLFPADIYVFDEVLAVVDDEFRARCLDEINRLIDGGRTVIFVSHDLQLVQGLCSRVLWLQNGRVRALGPSADVLAAYQG